MVRGARDKSRTCTDQILNLAPLPLGYSGAEDKGFEPCVGLPTPVFKTDAVGHSTNPPYAKATGFEPVSALAVSKQLPWPLRTASTVFVARAGIEPA